ncbi:MAG: LLM class flavin-dependent oxidoreductase [Pseudomonadota bacterium]
MTVAIGLGLMEFPFADAAGYWRWVDLCEAGGIDSLWQTDRLVSREPILECMTAIAALAGRTRRLKFGMNVVSLALRDPVLVAKQCATIDVLSEGRLLPAFGVGSPLAPEWKALDLDTKTRGRRTDEGLEIIRRLWTEDSVDFAGEHYRLSGASISPKPVQADLPMWIGGSSEAAIRRTARYGTGWQAGPERPEEAAPGGRRDPRRGDRGRPADRRRPLRRRLPVLFRLAGRSRARARHAGLSETHQARSARLFCGRRRRGDHRAHRRLCRRRGRKIRVAAGRRARRRDVGSDAAADRAGAAARRRALAEAGESGRLLARRQDWRQGGSVSRAMGRR